MPAKSLTVLVPEEVAAQIDEAARSQYLSRSDVVRQIIIAELERRRRELEDNQPGVAA